MREKVKIIDLNAHIENVKCEIHAESNCTKALISFQNLGFGDITAIKFIATGYNTFGDIVKINNNDKFYIIIQDICIEKNGIADNLKVTLPSDEIRKLELSEYQICYKDNSVSTYTGTKFFEAHLMMYEKNIDEEYKVLQALRTKFNDHISYAPVQLEDGWICSCGRYNASNSTSCSLCQCDKNELIRCIQEDMREALISEYQNAQRLEAQKVAQEAKEKQKAKKKKIIKIAIITVISVIIAIVLGRALTLASRTTYNSEQEMKDELQGTYTYYDPSTGKANRQLVISGDKAIYKWSSWAFSDMDVDIREWDYKNGKIHTFEDIVVLASGDLKDDDGDLFKKGGRLTKNSPYDNFESAYTSLKISNVNLSSNSSYEVCTGTIKNTGSKTYSFVKVKGSFKNSSGEVIDTDWTYAVGSEGLAPNESKTFRLSVPENYEIKKCSVSIIDYD